MHHKKVYNRNERETKKLQISLLLALQKGEVEKGWKMLNCGQELNEITVAFVLHTCSPEMYVWVVGTSEKGSHLFCVNACLSHFLWPSHRFSFRFWFQMDAFVLMPFS